MPRGQRTQAIRAKKSALPATESARGSQHTLLNDRRHPGMLETPELWEALWAKDLQSQWHARGKLGNPNVTFASHTTPEEAKIFAREEQIINLEALLASVTRHQLILGSDVAARAVTHDYEKDFKGLTDKRRREVILEGVCNAMRSGVIVPGRMYCPDSTVAFLASNGGSQYLEYLRMLIPQDLHALTAEPRTIPHPVVDRYLTLNSRYTTNEGYKSLGRTNWAIRIQCLTSIIYEIFHVFCGHPFTERTTIKAPFADARSLNDLYKCYGRSSVQRTKEDMRQFGPASKAFEPACWRCGKSRSAESVLRPSSSSTNPGVELKLMACRKCREVGRTVLYCSKECQIDDWRHGMPRPHKTVCGQPVDEDSFVKEANEPQREGPFVPPTDEEFLALPRQEQLEMALFPPPDPSFKRSLALELQIRQLRLHPEAHYIIFTGIRGCEMFSIAYNNHDEVLYKLLLSRGYAFHLGDPHAVKELYARVCYLAGLHHVPHEVVKRQMEKEFPSISLDDVPLDWISYEEGEMEEPDTELLEGLRALLKRTTVS